jgi:hypothetical protein
MNFVVKLMNGFIICYNKLIMCIVWKKIVRRERKKGMKKVIKKNVLQWRKCHEKLLKLS